MIWLLTSCGQQDSNEKVLYAEDLEMEEAEPEGYEHKPKLEGRSRVGGIGGAPPPPSPTQAASEEAGSIDLFSVLGSKGLQMEENTFGSALGIEETEDTTSVRSWFPESFIFEPLIVTDTNGQASHQFTVPDRLTTWRILGLAHNKTGQTSGTVHEILGTLPQYVDPVIPPFLRLGDRVILPIMVSNTTNSDLASKLSVDVQGGKTTRGTVNLKLAPNATTSIDIPVESTELGSLSVEAKLQGIDAIKDDLTVFPVGKRQQSTESGILVATHNFEWQPPRSTLPNTTELQLSIYPGTVGFFRSELNQAANHHNWEGNAYSIVLANRAQTLFDSLGIPVDINEHHKLVEQQSQMLYLRIIPRIFEGNDEIFEQMDAIEALLAVPDNIEMKRTGLVLANLLADSQRPDGTFGNATTVQELLVKMAKTAMVFERAAEMDNEISQRSDRVRQLINRGIPRLWKQSSDPYTAAWLHVAGLGNESERDEWERIVRDSAKQEDGHWILELPDAVVGPEGKRPTKAEFHALGMKVLTNEIELKSSLLGSVLSNYQPGHGWGNPSRNRLILGCIEDVAQQGFPDVISLKVYENDVVLNELVISKEQMQDLIHIQLPIDGKSDSRWRLESNPPVPNMSFTGRFSHYEPIEERSEVNGLEFEMTRPRKIKSNTPTTIPVALSLPRGSEFEMRLSLPSGIKITPDSEANLTNQMSYTVLQTDEQLTISGKMSDKTLLKFNIEVTAQFKGILSGGAHVMKSGQHELVLAPQKWTVE